MSQRDYLDQMTREISHWGDVNHTQERGAKHPRLVLSFGDRSRFICLPGTPGDNARGLKIKISELRRTLRDLGAIRNPRPVQRRRSREFECAGHQSRASP